MVKQCPSLHSCLKCGKRHHTLLHVDDCKPPENNPEVLKQDIPNTDSPPSTTPPPPPASSLPNNNGANASLTYVATPQASSLHTVLMMTAEVDVLKPGLILGPKGTRAAQDTVFGWVLLGNTNGHHSTRESVTTLHASTIYPSSEETLQKSWALEELPKTKVPVSPADKLALKHCNQHLKHEEMVALLLNFLSNDKHLPSGNRDLLPYVAFYLWCVVIFAVPTSLNMMQML